MDRIRTLIEFLRLGREVQRLLLEIARAWHDGRTQDAEEIARTRRSMQEAGQAGWEAAHGAGPATPRNDR